MVRTTHCTTYCTPKPRSNWQETALESGKVLYTDGSSYMTTEGKRVTGYAVCDGRGVVKAGPMSAQGAELHALAEACRLSEGENVTIQVNSSNRADNYRCCYCVMQTSRRNNCSAANW